VFLQGLHRADYWPTHRDYRALRGIGCSAGARQNFLLDVLHKFLDLALHLFHAFTHLQDDRHASDIHAKIAGQREDKFQTKQIFICVETRIALGTRRFKQALAFVETEGLGVNALHFGNGGNHVGALRFPFGHGYPLFDSRARINFPASSGLVPAAKNGAKPKPPSGIVIGGGFLWTKIMLSV